MRCIACDRALNDFESTRKYEDGSFVDLCNHCFKQSDMSDIVILERADLQEYEDIGDDFFEESEVEV